MWEQEKEVRQARSFYSELVFMPTSCVPYSRHGTPSLFRPLFPLFLRAQSLYAVEVSLCSYRRIHSSQTPTIVPSLAVHCPKKMRYLKKGVIGEISGKLLYNGRRKRVERMDGWMVCYPHIWRQKSSRSTGMKNEAWQKNIRVSL